MHNSNCFARVIQFFPAVKHNKNTQSHQHHLIKLEKNNVLLSLAFLHTTRESSKLQAFLLKCTLEQKERKKEKKPNLNLQL